MSEEEKIRKIIRLKRHERPPEGYFEDFLEEFRNCRDRESRPLPSRRGLGAGRFASWFRGKRGSAWVLGSGLAYAALILVIVWWPKGVSGDPDVNRQPVIYEPGPEPRPGPPPPEETVPDSKF